MYGWDEHNINNLKEQFRKSVGSLIISIFQNCSKSKLFNVFGYTYKEQGERLI